MSGTGIVRLADATVKVGSGSTPRGGEATYKPSGTPLIRSMNVHFDGFRETGLAYIDREQADSLRNVEVRASDVLLNITGASIGRVTIAPPHMAGARVNQHVCIIRPDQRLEPSYLRWFLASPRQQRLINSVESGATRQALTKEKILGFEVPLLSLQRQQEVVAEIEKQFSRLDEAIANLQRVKAHLKRYKASVLKAAVEGRLVESEASVARREHRTYVSGEQLLQRVLTTRRAEWGKTARYGEPEGCRNTLDTLPEGWAWSTVEQLNPGNRPCAYGVLQPGEDVADGVPFVRVGDIFDGRIELDGMKRINDDIAAAYPRTRLLGGEVLLTLVGAIGRTAVVPPVLVGGNVARAVGVLPISPLVDAHWVEIWFRNPAKVAEMTSKSHEVARKTLNLEDVRLSAVALPPLAEQRRVVAEVDRLFSNVREIEVEVDANLKRAQTLRQAILAKAFSSPHA